MNKTSVATDKGEYEAWYGFELYVGKYPLVACQLVFKYGNQKVVIFKKKFISIM